MIFSEKKFKKKFNTFKKLARYQNKNEQGVEILGKLINYMNQSALFPVGKIAEKQFVGVYLCQYGTVI